MKIIHRINTFNIKNGGGLLRLTSANISTQYQLNNNTFKRGQSEEQINESKFQEEEEQMIYLVFHKISLTQGKMMMRVKRLKKLI